MYSLDPSIKTIWTIAIFIRFLIYSSIIGFIEFFIIPGNVNSWFFPKGFFSMVLFFIGILLTIIIPILKYRFWKFEVREDEIYIERGIFTRIKTIAPYRRIQHLDVQQSILERFAQLGKLVIYTAGTRGADVIIPGLPIEYAEDLRDRLKVQTYEDAI